MEDKARPCDWIHPRLAHALTLALETARDSLTEIPWVPTGEQWERPPIEHVMETVGALTAMIQLLDGFDVE
jgi:hypothetical protein